MLLVPWTCMAMRTTISWCSLVHTWQAPSQQPVALQLVRCKYTQCSLCQSPCHSPPSLQAVFFWMPLKTGSTHLIPSVEGNFLTSQQKKSLSMRMWLLMNMDMQTPHGIAQGWGLAAIVLCWTFLVFSVDLLSRGGNLKLSNTPQSIFLFGKCFTLYGATLWNGGHYICTLYYNNMWYMYDGLSEYTRKGSGLWSCSCMFHEPLGFSLSFLIYCS